MAPQTAEQITATPPVATLRTSPQTEQQFRRSRKLLWLGFLLGVVAASGLTVGGIKLAEAVLGPGAAAQVKGVITVASESALGLVGVGYVAVLVLAWLNGDFRAAARRYAFLYTALAAVPFTGIVIGLSYYLLSAKTVAPNPTARIVIPYEAGFDWVPFRHWIVQEDGRNKPFDSFCRESARAICGRERFEYVSYGSNRFAGHDPVAMVVSWMMLSDPDRQAQSDAAVAMHCDWEHYPFLLCDNQELRRLLYFDLVPDPTPEQLHGRYVAPADLRNSPKFREVAKEGRMKRAEDSKAALPEVTAKALEVQHRLDIYDRIREGSQKSGGEFGLVALDKYGPVWFPLNDVREHVADPKLWAKTMRARRIEHYDEYKDKPEQPFPETEAKQVLAAYSGLQAAYRSGDADRFAAASTDFFQTLDHVSKTFNAYPNASAPEVELWYNRAVPFQKAWIFNLLAAVVLLGSLVLAGRPAVSRVLYVGGLLSYLTGMGWALAGFTCRCWVTGRPPISNMYESVIFVAFMTSAFGLALELVYRQGMIALAASLVSWLGFVLADQLPLTLDPKISPLVAVLRSNYWLIIHVMTIVSSYAAFALAWGLGNINLGFILFAPGRQDTIKTLSKFSYRAIQIGVILLFLGTMLGGFWAAESWGRFWGWDPKEVWALIAFLCYIIPLHARYVGWVKDFGLAVCSVVCFAAVVMAWYGVNFVLAAGLHSYGFGGGDNLWVTWAAMINVDLVLCGALSFMHRRNLALAPAA
jgi:ABC-type transport system involved in cytochrome c biogenesis permease subunit